MFSVNESVNHSMDQWTNPAVDQTTAMIDPHLALIHSDQQTEREREGKEGKRANRNRVGGGGAEREQNALYHTPQHSTTRQTETTREMKSAVQNQRSVIFFFLSSFAANRTHGLRSGRLIDRVTERASAEVRCDS